MARLVPTKNPVLMPIKASARPVCVLVPRRHVTSKVGILLTILVGMREPHGVADLVHSGGKTQAPLVVESGLE
jgi:hypothetical protein